MEFYGVIIIPILTTVMRNRLWRNWYRQPATSAFREVAVTDRGPLLRGNKGVKSADTYFLKLREKIDILNREFDAGYYHSV